jgi:hypothetical protein
MNMKRLIERIVAQEKELDAIASPEARERALRAAAYATLGDVDLLLLLGLYDQATRTARPPGTDREMEAAENVGALMLEYAEARTAGEAVAIYLRHYPDVVNFDEPTLKALRAVGRTSPRGASEGT